MHCNLFQFFYHPCLLAHFMCYSNLPSNFKAVFCLVIWLYFDKTPRVSVTFVFFPFCCFFWWKSSSVMSSYVSSIFGATFSSSRYLKSAEKWVKRKSYQIHYINSRQAVYLHWSIIIKHFLLLALFRTFCCCFTKKYTKRIYFVTITTNFHQILPQISSILFSLWKEELLKKIIYKNVLPPPLNPPCTAQFHWRKNGRESLNGIKDEF